MSLKKLSILKICSVSNDIILCITAIMECEFIVDDDEDDDDEGVAVVVDFES